MTFSRGRKLKVKALLNLLLYLGAVVEKDKFSSRIPYDMQAQNTKKEAYDHTCSLICNAGHSRIYYQLVWQTDNDLSDPIFIFLIAYLLQELIFILHNMLIIITKEITG